MTLTARAEHDAHLHLYSPCSSGLWPPFAAASLTDCSHAMWSAERPPPDAAAGVPPDAAAISSTVWDPEQTIRDQVRLRCNRLSAAPMPPARSPPPSSCTALLLPQNAHRNAVDDNPTTRSPTQNTLDEQLPSSACASVTRNLWRDIPAATHRVSVNLDRASGRSASPRPNSLGRPHNPAQSAQPTHAHGPRSTGVDTLNSLTLTVQCQCTVRVSLTAPTHTHTG